MLATLDWYGLAAVISAVGAVLTALVGTFVNARKIDAGTARAKDAADLAAVTAQTAQTAVEAVHTAVVSPNGTTTGQAVHDLATKLDEVAAEVRSPNGSTTGQAISDLVHNVEALTSQVGAHVADGHGGQPVPPPAAPPTGP
jgi:hypothetical protein